MSDAIVMVKCCQDGARIYRILRTGCVPLAKFNAEPWRLLEDAEPSPSAADHARALARVKFKEAKGAQRAGLLDLARKDGVL